MTRRERLEAKLAKREQWAEGRERKAEASFGRASAIVNSIPLGQPILVGHHSEKRHRRDLDRMASAMDAGVESSKMAAHHRSKAMGLEAQLDGSIFSDDPDAVEALEARIAALEAKRARLKLINTRHKQFKAGKATWGEGLNEAEKAWIQSYEPAYSWEPHPTPPYRFQNLGGNISRLRKRLEHVKVRQVRMAKAEEVGVLIEGTGEYVRVTFPEKPAREVLNALRAAGFAWGGGSWTGRRDALPEVVKKEVA